MPVKEGHRQAARPAAEDHQGSVSICLDRQRAAHQLGVERNVLISNKVKSDVQAERTATDHKLVNLRNRQRNQLQELRDRYEEIKVAERVNRLEQEKALKELQSGNRVLKGQVKTKLVIKKEFII